MSYYTANATTLNRNSKGVDMLEHIISNNGATKYECLTQALGKIGSKEKLRGYYSCYFRGWVDSGVVTLNHITHKYPCTKYGASLYLTALTKEK